MEEYSYNVRIPKDRIAVLIGSKGETKRSLEGMSDCKINIDSDEGEVVVKGNNTLNLFQLKDLIKAIGRGFNPETAKLLMRQDYVLEVLDISDYAGDKKSHLQRVRGRLIGTDGKCRETIEGLSKTFISIYGKTVSIIGTAERANIARNSLQKLLSGSPHGPVYARLQEECKALNKKEKLSM